MKVQFKLSGLHCEACERLSAKRIGKIDGVSAVAVNKDSGLAEIETEREISLSEINQALSDTEYRAELN